MCGMERVGTKTEVAMIVVMGDHYKAWQNVQTEVESGTSKNHPTTKRQSLAALGLDPDHMDRTLGVVSNYSGCL